MKKKQVPKTIRDWMAKNGRKGGKAGKGSPARIAANKRTAQNRWRKLHPAPPELPSFRDKGISGEIHI